MQRRKLASISLGIALLVSLAASIPTIAQETSKSVNIGRDCKLGTQMVAKGSYTIKFDETKDGEMRLLKGKQEVAKVGYKLTELKTSPVDTIVVYTQAADGTLQIKRIEIKGRKMAIAIES